MTCQECSEKLTEYMEGELPADVEARLIAHLDSCSECRDTVADLRAVVGAVTGLPEIAPPAGLRESIGSALEEHAGARQQRAGRGRLRYWVSGVAAAAVATIVIWTGVTQMQPTATMGRETPAAIDMVADAPLSAPASDGEALSETAETDQPPAASEPVVAEPAEEPHAEEVMIAAAPVVTPAELRPRGERSARAPVVAHETIADPADAPIPAMPPAPGMEGDTSDDAARAESTHGTGAPSPPSMARTMGASEMPADRAPGLAMTGAPGAAGAAGVAGPAGPAAMAIADRMSADAEEGMLRVEPRYFEADATMVARTPGPVGDTPFTVSVFPPGRRVVGELVPATVTVETERTVDSARIRVIGLRSLEIVGADEDGVIYRGVLEANQRTEQTVQMRAQQPGMQSMIVNLRSSNPEVETDLVVDMGEFEHEEPATEANLQLLFHETPIGEAIEQIRQNSRMQIMVNGDLPDTRVSKDFSVGVPAQAALRIVVEDVGWQLREAEEVQIIEAAH